MCTHGCAGKLAPFVAKFDNFMFNFKPIEMTALTKVLREIEKAHPLLIDFTTELRSLAAEFFFICMTPGEERRQMRLDILRQLRALQKQIDIF